MKRIFFFCFFSMVLLSSRCKTDEPTCRENYRLELPITITPKDTFKIGDTIWVQLLAANKELKFKDKEGNMKIGNWDMGVYMLMSRIDTFASWDEINKYEASHFFDIFSVKGSIKIMRNSYFQKTFLRFDTLGSHQTCKIGIVPHKLGIFDIGFQSDPTNELINKPPLVSGCIDMPEVWFNPNNRDCNYYLHQKILGRPVESEEKTIINGAYAFVVIP